MQLTFNPPGNSTNRGENAIAPIKRRSDRVRDHLANERTYLSWMRSAISLLGFGVVIVRIRMFQPPLMPSSGNSWKLGLAFALVGLITVWLSTQHYYAIRRDIDADTYEPSDRWISLFSLAVLILGAGITYYVFTAQPMTSFSFE